MNEPTLEIELEPQNVFQVVVKEADGGEPAHLQLQDVDGVFPEAAPMHQGGEEAELFWRQDERERRAERSTYSLCQKPFT